MYPRGKGLGGCSAINGMIYSRGQPRDYDAWAAATGAPHWAWEAALPDFLAHGWLVQAAGGGLGCLRADLTKPSSLPQRTTTTATTPSIAAAANGASLASGFDGISSRPGRGPPATAMFPGCVFGGTIRYTRPFHGLTGGLVFLCFFCAIDQRPQRIPAA
jgi:choline dehydrogenase-like flavoprotein